MRIKRYIELEEINEKINFKNIRKSMDITVYTLMSIFIGYNVLPKHIRNTVSEKIAYEYINYKIKKLNDVNINKNIKNAINDVIDKVKNSRNIENKEYVIDRIRNVKIKYYDKKTKILGTSKSGVLLYFYNEYIDEDYIFLNRDKSIIDDGYHGFIHELNHLVDKHKIDKEKIDIKNLITKPTKEDYLRYFKNFKKVNIENINFHDVNFDRKIISIGDIYYKTLKNKESYYLSESEIYARISNMKNVFVKLGYININDNITEETLEKFKKRLINLQKNWDDEVFIGVLNNLDFIHYLPILSKEKLNNLNLIAEVDKDHNDTFISTKG